jgi:hypothetical protein
MTTTAPPINTKRGRVTPYGLACGYIEQFEHNGKRVTLWLEHGALHVRAHDFTEHQRLFWDCPETLTAARARFDRAKREFKMTGGDKCAS